MILSKNWYVPFEDFFSHLPGDIDISEFGADARIESLKFCKKRNCVIDVGAHVGISVNHWSQEFSKVYAFEPLKDHFDCLIKNTENIKNAVCYNIGLGNKEGIFQGAYRSLKNSGSFQQLDEYYRQPKNENKIRKIYNIDIKKLDSFEFDEIDLIKIDVEGWEAEVLEGAVETIKKHKPVLQIEVLVEHPNKTLKFDYNLDKFYKIINDLDYKEAMHIVPDDKIFIPNE